MDQGRKLQYTSIFDQLDSKINFNDLVALVIANKWFIVISATVCLLLGIFHVKNLTPTYSANLLVRIQSSDRAESVLGKAAVPISLPGGGASPADTESVLIKSPYIIEPVIKKMGLGIGVEPDYFPFFGEKYASKHDGKLTRPFFGLSKYAWGGEKIKIDEIDVPPALVNKKITLVALKNQQYQLFDQNKNLLLTGVVGKTEQAILPQGILVSNVSLLIANPGAHFFVVKGDTKAIVDSLAQQIQISDLGTIEGIADHTGILQISLVGTSPQYIVTLLNTIAAVAVQKDIEKKSIEMLKTLAFLNQELLVVKKSLDQATLALSAYQAKTGVMDVKEATSSLMGRILKAKENLYNIQLKKSMDLEKYTPAHPHIQMLDAQEREAQKHLDILKEKEQKLPLSEREGVSLMNDVKIKGELYTILLNKIQSLQVVQAGTESDMQVLKYATVPNSPIPVNKFMICFASLVIGAGLAIFFVIFKSIIYSKISDPDDIESKFGLKNMAIVPYSDDQEKILQSYDPKRELLPLIAKVMPRSMPMEALRSFRTSLKIAMMGASNNVITISGVSPSVGKSFISANLAFLFSDSGKKVLLIDGDMRRGNLKNYFRLGNYPGFSDLLSGKALVSEAIVKNAFPDLDFIATGAYPENASELLVSENYKNLIRHVSPLYDLVIIDTPPILAVTDAAIIAEQAGANFMVFGSGKHETKEVDLALKRFSASNIKINGYIFNVTSAQKGIYRQQVETYSYQYEYK